MRGPLLLIAGLLAACSTSSPVASLTPPTPSASAPASVPVEFFASTPAYTPPLGGFVDISTGQFAADQQSAVTRFSRTLAGTSAGSTVQQTSAEPYLYGTRGSAYGFGSVTYDARAARWLPVPRNQVSRDGEQYTYSEEFYPPMPQFSPGRGGCCPDPVGGRVHIVDVSTAKDVGVVDFLGWPDYQVLLFSKQVIYLQAECNGDHPGCNELWGLDLLTMKLRVVIARQAAWWYVAGNYAWAVTIGNGDIEPIQLLRVDLGTGSSQTWFEQPAMSASNPYAPSMVILGVDNEGAPWVALNSRSPSPLMRITAPNQADQIFAADGPYSELVVDTSGVWFAVVDNASPKPTMLGLYLYRPQSGAVKVTSLSVLPV